MTRHLSAVVAIALFAAVTLMLATTACSTSGNQGVPDSGEANPPAAEQPAEGYPPTLEAQEPAPTDDAYPGSPEDEQSGDGPGDSEGTQGQDSQAEDSQTEGNTGDTADAGDEASESDDLVEIEVTQPPMVEDTVFVQGDEVVELPESDSPLIGQPAPDFTMTDVQTGEEVSLGDYEGQPVLLNFWGTWCPPCRLEMPWFQTAYEEHADEGFVVVAVDVGERVPPEMLEDMVKRFADSAGLTFPVVVGDNALDVQEAYGVAAFPTSFLIDEDGTVVDAHRGAYPNYATLEGHLTQILGETDGEG